MWNNSKKGKRKRGRRDGRLDNSIVKFVFERIPLVEWNDLRDLVVRVDIKPRPEF